MPRPIRVGAERGRAADLGQGMPINAKNLKRLSGLQGIGDGEESPATPFCFKCFQHLIGAWYICSVQRMHRL